MGTLEEVTRGLEEETWLQRGSGARAGGRQHRGEGCVWISGVSGRTKSCVTVQVNLMEGVRFRIQSLWQKRA